MSEACALRVGDIDSAGDRMCVRVNAGKGGGDRYSLLSASLLQTLRHYCHTFAPQRNAGRWLFPNAQGAGAVNIENVQRAYQGARHGAGITKRGGTHTLRHYAESQTMPHVNGGARVGAVKCGGMALGHSA